jgi:hypothetical protein
MRVIGWETRSRNEGECGRIDGGREATGRSGRPRYRYDPEHICRDPKDGELCLSRTKPGETLVEVRSDTDVQIVRLT